MWGWLAAMVAAAAAAWLVWRLGKAAGRERERRLLEGRRRDERERARRVLEGGAHPLADAPVPLRPGEAAYYRTPALLLDPEPDGGFRRRASGELVVTNRALWFQGEDSSVGRTPVNEIQRVEVPFVDVIALVAFEQTVARDERRAYYRVAEPLVLAAHLARFAGFELMLD